jgi:hypothetical protein
MSPHAKTKVRGSTLRSSQKGCPEARADTAGCRLFCEGNMLILRYGCCSRKSANQSRGIDRSPAIAGGRRARRLYAAAERLSEHKQSRGNGLAKREIASLRSQRQRDGGVICLRDSRQFAFCVNAIPLR